MCVLYDIVMTRKLKFTVLDDPTCCRCVCTIAYTCACVHIFKLPNNPQRRSIEHSKLLEERVKRFR